MAAWYSHRTRMRRSTRTSSTSGSTTKGLQEARRSLHNQRERSSTTRMSGSSRGRRLRARVLTGSHRGERLISLLSPESLQVNCDPFMKSTNHRHQIWNWPLHIISCLMESPIWLVLFQQWLAAPWSVSFAQSYWFVKRCLGNFVTTLHWQIQF